MTISAAPEPGQGGLDPRLDGFVAPDASGWTVGFDRTYETTPADLWACLTEPDRMSGWLGPVERLTLAPGGEVVLLLHPQNGARLEAEILEMVPNRLLELSWTVPEHRSTPRFEGSILRLEVTSRGGHAALSFRQRHLPAARTPYILAASHLRLDQLPSVPGAQAKIDPERFGALKDRYLVVAQHAGVPA